MAACLASVVTAIAIAKHVIYFLFCSCRGYTRIDVQNSKRKHFEQFSRSKGTFPKMHPKYFKLVSSRKGAGCEHFF